MTLGFVLMALFLGAAGVWLYRRDVHSRRTSYLGAFELPADLLSQLRQRRPELSVEDADLAGRALHQFFRAAQANGLALPIPSQVTAELWQLFAASTHAYDAFCRSAFGRLLPPTSAVGLRGSVIEDEALERTWTHACRQEGIQPHRPSRLPLLFAVDTSLRIADGFGWVLDCSETAIDAQRKATRHVYCVEDLARMVPRGGADNCGEGGSVSASMAGGS